MDGRAAIPALLILYRESINQCRIHSKRGQKDLRNYERTRCSVFISQVQARVIRGDNEANDESPANVEEEDPDVHPLDCSGQITTRVLSFACCDCNDFGTNERESGLCLKLS